MSGAVASWRTDVRSIVRRTYPLRGAPKAFEDCIDAKAAMVKAAVRFEDA